MNDGDWICSDANCGNINFARRVSCYRCNKERPDGSKSFKKKLGTEIGKTAAEKSRGLFNADDWQCNKCANVNWARRQTCNVCNAPKYGEVEARTGYGGGYNERGVVEYRRREPSSDDEYDEFGRKKRKRKAESQEKVGITEGAVIKMLPSTVPQKESNMESVKPVLDTDISRRKAIPQENVNDSVSDGSMCEISHITKSIKNKYEQIHHKKQEQPPPAIIKSNGVQSRKRIVSAGDKDQAPSGYEACSKKSKRDSTISPVIKYNPVMENMVSSTNNDVVYKFSGPTPAENFQVTYTLEERVRAAAYAIVYNNCKISTDKFESLFDKPAPDFKTIFGWRQRLLTTGCLADTHVDSKKDTNERPLVNELPNIDDRNKKKAFKLPNPDEIIIPSESEEEIENNSEKPSPRSPSVETVLISHERDQGPTSPSTGDDRGSTSRSHSRSTHRRTCSSSRDSQDSNYLDTDSEKAGTKSVNLNTAPSSKSANISARQSLIDSDSDSVSYNSEDNNFLSRVFPNRDGRKRRKPKKRTVPPATTKVDKYVPNEIQRYEGYSTIKPTVEQSPLVTGNIYTTNLRNMNVKPREKISVDVENCSSEYVPTRLGSTAKKNYQEFKDNVRKKGYWAKGNGATIVKNRHSISTDIPPIAKPVPMKPREESIIPIKPRDGSSYCPKVQSYEVQTNFPKKQPDFTKDDVDSFTPNKQYLPFESVPMQSRQVKSVQIQPHRIIPAQINPVQLASIQMPVPPLPVTSVQVPLGQKKPVQVTSIQVVPVQKKPGQVASVQMHPVQQVASVQMHPVQKKPVQVNPIKNKPVLPPPVHHKPLQMVHNIMLSPERPDRIFAVVQSNSAAKNRSITDIFGNGLEDKSPDRDDDLRKYDSVRKMFETEWDEDDDALYKNTESVETVASPRRSPSTSTSRSPMSNMLYASTELPNQVTPNKVPTADFIKDKQDMLLDMLKDFQNKEIGEVLSPLKHMTPQKVVTSQNQPVEDTGMKKFKAHSSALASLYTNPEPIPIELSDEVLQLSGEHINIDDEEDTQKSITPSKKVHIIESVTIQPGSFNNEMQTQQEKVQRMSPESPDVDTSDNVEIIVSPENKSNDNELPIEPPLPPLPPEEPEMAALQPTPQMDLSNLLSGINTNTLLLALQNLQQLTQNSSPDVSNKQTENEQNNSNENVTPVETINLTNDEDWERESNRDGSIERQLEKLDGNTGDTPFLGDIFDPGPVLIPPNVARKLNLDVNLSEDPSNTQSNANENGPVIGNFKSFALPKPILLNRLKLTVKTADKTTKTADGKRVKRKKKTKTGSQDAAGGEEDDDEEESGDEADLSKYDLWGSDAEQGNSSKTDNADKDNAKDSESSKDGEAKSQADKNDKRDKSGSPVSKSSKRRSRSSSSSSSSSTSSSSSHSSIQAPKNKFDDFNLNSERESSPKGRKSRSRSRSPRNRSGSRRKSRDSRSAGESRSHESSRDKEWSRDRDRRDRSRGSRDERKERRYSRDGSNHYGSRGRHR